MSFGSSVGDCILLAQLALNTYQGAKKACGEHDELTREVSSLYKVLNRMGKELSNPESLVNRASNDKRQELEEHAAGCEGILKTMNNVLTKYNALTGEQRRGQKLWQKIKFGNGQTKDLADIRIKLSAHTSAIMMSLNLCSLDSPGRVEAALGRVEARSTSHGEQLRGIRKALHWVTANMAATSSEGSVWTSYTNDDQTFWRELRRELAKEGYRGSTLQRHKRLIKNYVEELGNRGVFDDILDLEEGPNEVNHGPDGDSIDAGQSTLISEVSSIDFLRDDPEVPNSPDNRGCSSSRTKAPKTDPSTANSQQFGPADKHSSDHDGSHQHNHASDGSHIESNTAGQDENDLSDIPLMATTSVGEVMVMSEKFKVGFEFESVENMNPASTCDEDYSCTPVSEASANDKSDEEIERPDISSLDDTTFVEENLCPPSSESLEYAEDVENIGILDSLSNLESNKQMTPMLESFMGIQGHPSDPHGQSPTPPNSPSNTPAETIPISDDGIDIIEHSVSPDIPDIHSRYERVDIPVERSPTARSPFAVQIEEVLDEEFARHTRPDALKELKTTISDQEASQPSMGSHDEALSENRIASESISTYNKVSIDEVANGVRLEPPPPVSVEEVLDDDFSVDAHPNVSTANVTFDYNSDTGATLAWRDSVECSAGSSTQQKKPPKKVRFANTGPTCQPSESSATKWTPEDLRFIFYGETRDFNSYQELQESYQALFDEAEGGYNSIDFNKPENTTTFITHSPYTPPATMYDLQYYRVPASYFHTFWHPQRVPIYLHGNVFDGISLTNWIYNWTAYTFKDNSYQMNAVRRFGKTVVKLGSALSDIEHAKPAVKAKLPRDLYDESGVLWADLENIINDIMSEAEDRLEASKQGGRLEVEFVSRFCHELIAGKKYYRPIEKFLKKTEAWCKNARFHPDFIMLWELWES